MRKFVILTGLLGVFIVAGLIFCNSVVATPQTKPIEVARSGFSALNFNEVSNVKLNSNYLLYIPPAYLEKKNEKWPLIVMLHGSGERGCSPKHLSKFGPFQAAQRQRDFPFLVLGPVCPKGHWWSDATTTLSVMGLIDNIVSQYNVDPNRIYLTGFSMGGFGTWDYAIQFPRKFAAIAPICGGGNPYRVSRIRHLPVMVFHGKNDKKVPFWQAQQMALTLSKMGGNVKFMMYPNTGHYIWQKVYEKPSLYSWFLQHNRQNNWGTSSVESRIRSYTPPGKKIKPKRLGTRI